MRALEGKAGGDLREPLPEDRELYMRLVTAKRTLEWVYPHLIKTKGKGGERFVELSGYKHWVMGPAHDLLYP